MLPNNEFSFINLHRVNGNSSDDMRYVRLFSEKAVQLAGRAASDIRGVRNMQADLFAEERNPQSLVSNAWAMLGGLKYNLKSAVVFFENKSAIKDELGKALDEVSRLRDAVKSDYRIAQCMFHDDNDQEEDANVSRPSA